MPPPFRFYKKFWDEYEALNGDVQDALTAFLEQLQKKSSSAEFLAQCEGDGKSRFARQFHANYVIFWRFERGYEGNFTDIKGDVLKIDILAISPLDRIDEDLLKPFLSPPRKP